MENRKEEIEKKNFYGVRKSDKTGKEPKYMCQEFPICKSKHSSDVNVTL